MRGKRLYRRESSPTPAAQGSSLPPLEFSVFLFGRSLNSGFQRPVQNLSTDLSFRALVALPDVRIRVETQDSHPLLAFLSRGSWVRSPPPSPTSTRPRGLSRKSDRG